MTMNFKVVGKNADRYEIIEKGDAVCYRDSENLVLRSLECCAVIEVFNFAYTFDCRSCRCVFKEGFASLLKNLAENSIIECKNGWSEVCNSGANFVLQCTLAGKNQHEAWENWLLEEGWIKVASFFNPNTPSKCTTFMYIPKELRVD